jgi:hypothetical protein
LVILAVANGHGGSVTACLSRAITACRFAETPYSADQSPKPKKADRCSMIPRIPAFIDSLDCMVFSAENCEVDPVVAFDSLFGE